MPIVAAVDRSERAEAVVSQARELADSYDVSVHVIHVGEPDVSRVPKGVNTGMVDEISGPEDLGESSLPHEEIREAQKRAESTAREVANTYGVDDGNAIGLVGDPASQLLRYGEKADAEYIVVSTRKRSRVGKALFGSVTQSLLLNADRPVVVVGARTE